MDIRFDQVDKKLDKIDDRLSSIDITLAKQSVILDEHVKRSTQLENRMEPVEKHVEFINACFKIIGVIAIVTTILSNLYRIKDWISGLLRIVS